MNHTSAQDRAIDLLADRATQGLPDSEAAELTSLLLQNPGLHPDGLDLAAAALDLAFSGAATMVMPVALRRRLDQAAALWTDSRGQSSDAVIGRIDPDRPSRLGNWLGWTAAAACLALAAAGWWPRLFQGGGARAPMEIAAERQAFKGAVPDVAAAAWSDFNSLSDGAPPEVRGVTGEVCWSESAQSGFLTFKGLPVNDPAREQYQLWIIDGRGLNQRVSGGLFNATPSGGEVVVPIEPSLPVRGAAAFAVTIEPPGGNAVSDMSRRVVIASLPER